LLFVAGAWGCSGHPLAAAATPHVSPQPSEAAAARWRTLAYAEPPFNFYRVRGDALRVRADGYRVEVGGDGVKFAEQVPLYKDILSCPSGRGWLHTIGNEPRLPVAQYVVMPGGVDVTIGSLDARGFVGNHGPSYSTAEAVIEVVAGRAPCLREARVSGTTNMMITAKPGRLTATLVGARRTHVLWCNWQPPTIAQPR
jgi:hypothetical protein